MHLLIQTHTILLHGPFTCPYAADRKEASLNSISHCESAHVAVCGLDPQGHTGGWVASVINGPSGRQTPWAAEEGGSNQHTSPGGLTVLP